MPNSKYGVLIGQVEKIMADVAFDKRPHYKIEVITGQKEKYDVSINCKSSDDNYPKVLYHAEENFKNDITDILSKMDSGFHEIDYENNLNANIAIDYIRSGLLEPNKMRPLPYDIKGENDLKGFIDKYMKKALNNDKVTIYVFGTCYESGVKGIHNIHMNQGNRGTHYTENKTYHDGCFFIHFTEEENWIAYFLAFQSQSWNTDERGCPKD